MRRSRLLCAAFILLAGGLIAPADAVELKVLSAGAIRAALQELIPEYEKATGNKVTVEYATAGVVEQKVATDDSIDVAILSKPRLDKLVHQAKIVAGTVAPLAKAQIGLAVRKGAPHPDISSVEAFKQALLKAKSIAYLDPSTGGTSGIHLAQVIEKLGIAGDLKAKIKLITATPGQQSPRVGENIAAGEAEIGIQIMSELMEVPGLDVVGPLPAELQSQELNYVAGAPAFADHPAAPKNLIFFPPHQNAAATYRAKGLEPAPPRQPE